MADKQAVFTVSEAEAYHNCFGKKQDSQGFCEDSALVDLALVSTDGLAHWYLGCVKMCKD
jgi:hypothetical protein